ncbi:serine/threonine-protein kinase [Mycobacterium sherrisii]|uniref:serine/threonine-protein kinase n=1 Tax=Mycobacterium sherrisii TaxID=243061 RepID=UPI000A257F05|nr:serine/threonine-protein kinase [Mycobacterium sherrisii]ORW72791.1 protein kinase [Mycobacterium sherrisii]
MFTSHRARLGARFGPYELRSLLGAGDSSEVFEAYDTVNDRFVALKLVRAKTARSAGFQQRFWRDVAAAARLSEPHLAAIHDFGEIDGVPFVDMQLVSGASLRDRLSERGALDPSRAVSVVGQLARALDAAHAAGLVHGAVCPENVLLTADDCAYLVDFGTASSDDPAYRAPERFGGGRIGPQADVYSLACVLYECLTGQPPFEGTEHDVREAHLFSPAPRPSIMRRGIGRGLDDVIAAAMAKRPGARYGSAGAFARAAMEVVSPAYEPVPAAADPPLPRTRPFPAVQADPDDSGFLPPVEAPRPRRVVPGPAMLGVVAVLVLLAGVIAAAVSVFGGNGGTPSATPTAEPSSPANLPPPKTPTLSAPVRGADGLGFVGETARCDPANPPAAVVRTAKSLAVICENLSGTYYYRGERIRDGAHIELSNAERVADGFDVTNPVDGVRYEIRRDRLRILSGSHVDSSEPVLQYATAA